jgi:O-antigen/teichoic acid export membrane protein
VTVSARTQRLKGGLIQYALSVTSGLANFAALKILQHTAPNHAVYSQLSTILLSFTTYQLLTDLGTQTEFFRTFKNSERRELPALLHILLQSRLALGIVSFLVAAGYAFLAGFSSEMTLAFLVYQLAFIPFAFVSTADSFFLASEDFGRAILSRVARLVALALFLCSATLNKTNILLVSSLFSTLTFIIFAFATWFLLLRPHARGDHSLPILSLRWWQQAGELKKPFLAGSAIAGAFVVLQFVQSFVAQAFLVRSIGETSLSAINTSLAVATPAILAFQTLNQLQLPSVAQWTKANNKEIKTSLLRYAFRIGVVFVLMTTGLWIAHRLGWVSWFFPLSNTAVVQLSLITIATHAILNLGSPTLVLCQYKKRIQPLFWGMLISILMSWACQFTLTSFWPEAALLLSLLLFSILIGFFGLIILELHKSKDLNAS